MEVVQLELDLWKGLAIAERFPESANVVGLCDALERMMGGGEPSISEQLQWGGDVISRLAEVVAVRSERMIEGWESRYCPCEPVVALEDCVELFVQSLSLDVGELFEEQESVAYPVQRRSAARSEGSLVGLVDKQVLLELVDELEDGGSDFEGVGKLERALAIAHDEDLQAWCDRLRAFFLEHPAPITFCALVGAMQVSWVEVWMALLLGEFRVQQQGEFYDPDGIWVGG